MQGHRRNILIAVDASQHSFEAVRYVGQIVPPEGSAVTLLHVFDPIPESFYDLESVPSFRHQVIGVHAWEVQQKRNMEKFMEQAGRLLESRGYPRASIAAVIKEREVGIARDIVKEAGRGYDALVVGRKGMSPLKDLVMGSIANRLVSHVAQPPVWVIGDHPDTSRVLIAMDSSDGARRALEYVSRLWGRDHPELLLFHVTRGVESLMPTYEEALLESEWLDRARDQFKRAETAMMSVLKDASRYLERQGADAGRISTKISAGARSRAAAIIEEARQGGYGTIVLGRRGISRVEEFIMGRVSSKVLQLAPKMAVWVVH